MSDLASIRTSRNSIESLKENANRNIGEYEVLVNAAVREREEAFRALVGIYMPSLDHELKVVVERIFSEKESRRKELDSSMKESEKRVQKLNSDLEKISHQQEENARKTEGLQKKVSEALSLDERYQTLDDKAKAEKALVMPYVKSREGLEAIAREQLPQFMQNPFLKYLYKRKFGTPEYKGLFAALDRWVAGLSSYEHNVELYENLRSTPDRMKAVIEKRKEGISAIVKEMEGIEDEVEKREGLTGALDAQKELDRSLKDAKTELEKEKSGYQLASAERGKLDTSEDPYNIEAFTKLADYLKRMDIADLRDRAGRTKTTRDDELVDTIETLDAKIKEYNRAISAATREIDGYDEKIRSLKSEEARIRAESAQVTVISTPTYHRRSTNHTSIFGGGGGSSRSVSHFGGGGGHSRRVGGF